MAYVHNEIPTNANCIYTAFEEQMVNSTIYHLSKIPFNVIYMINEFVSTYGAFYRLLMDISIQDGVKH